MIIPILKPELQWPEIIRATTDMLEDSPIRKLNDFGIEPKKIVNYLQILYLLNHDANNQYETIVRAGTLTEHLFYGFMIHIQEKSLVKLYETNLRITPCDTIADTKLVFASGTLGQWYNAVIMMCDSKYSILNQLGTELYQYFCLQGYTGLWNKFEINNQTLLLERK